LTASETKKLTRPLPNDFQAIRLVTARSIQKLLRAARPKGHPERQAFRFMLSEAGTVIDTHEHAGDLKE